MRPKAENFFIAMGLAVLYLVTPSLSYQFRQSFAQPLVKQHINEEITKYDPETDLLSEIPKYYPETDLSSEIPLLGPIQELTPPAEEVPPLAQDVPARQLAYLPFVSTPGNTPSVAVRQPEVPIRIVIPAIGLNAPIVPAKSKVIEINGEKFRQWLVPKKFAAGWHKDSARMGEPGNTVLNGHHNAYGEVFVRLIDLNEGDLIQILSENHAYQYIITNKMILPEKYEDLDTRMNNAQWILPSNDERVTLITCWPYESNTHRLIIVAKPVAAP